MFYSFSCASVLLYDLRTVNSRSQLCLITFFSFFSCYLLTASHLAPAAQSVLRGVLIVLLLLAVCVLLNSAAYNSTTVQNHYRTLIGSHTLRVGWYYRNFRAMTESAEMVFLCLLTSVLSDDVATTHIRVFIFFPRRCVSTITVNIEEYSYCFHSTCASVL